MKNQRAIIGVVAGVALLAAAGIYMYYRNRPLTDTFRDKAEDMGGAYKGKLDALKQKAKKEYKNIKGNGEEFAHETANTAREWIDKAGTKL